jgi:hypothetical protein
VVSTRCRDLYLTTHNTRNRQTFVPPGGFDPVIPASVRLQTHSLDLISLNNILSVSGFNFI